MEGTRALVAALRAHPPNVLVSASAVGYYGSRGDEVLTEHRPAGARIFWASVAVAWEREAREAEKFGVRVVTSADRQWCWAGAAERSQKMLLPFRLGIGGRLGTGTQWMSWIHLEDLCAMILFALARVDSARGYECDVA